jgi:galactokinase
MSFLSSLYTISQAMTPTDTVRQKFEQEFRKLPRIFSAPGRVNIIGEHTDYNEGFVLPAAIDKAAYLAIAPADGNMGKWVSADFNEEVEIDFENYKTHEKGWVNYLLGVVDQFKKAGKEIPAFNLVLSADIPIGAGLSSSAALESVTAFALNEMHGFGLDKLELARLAQRAENQFIGLQCGIMDMFASLHGKRGNVMRLDCRSLEFEYFPLELGQYKIVLFDTSVKHSLASSEYNIRRQQCEEGVRILRKYYPQIKSLRDVHIKMLEEHKPDFDDVVYKRCYFVIEENKRVDKVCEALKIGSLHAAGQLMYASHLGLQNDYEVSSRELDLLVKLVHDETFVLGARMMGGGFGGCTINIIHQDAVRTLTEKLAPIYKENTGMELHTYEVVTGDGAREVT